MKVDFVPTNEDGSPRVYVGMHRPPMMQPKGYVACSCGSILQTVQMTQSHWQMGHFDVPLYQVPDDEALS